MNRFLLFIALFISVASVYSQSKNTHRARSPKNNSKIEVNAYLKVEKHTLGINEKIIYTNTSSDTLRYLYLNDWANSFTSRNTPLAKRLATNYKKAFHFANVKERGNTQIGFIFTGESSFGVQKLQWTRVKNHPDIVKVKLNPALPPGETIKLNLFYLIKIPSAKFTRYGYEDRNFRLRYWYLTPVVYDEEWKFYSNKNLGDLYTFPSEVSISINVPANYQVISPLNQIEEKFIKTRKRAKFQGKNRTDSRIYLTVNPNYPFQTFKTPSVNVVTNLKSKKLSRATKTKYIQKIVRFLDQRLGNYPFDKILITRQDYLASPVYGLNQLPKFIRPFSDGFQYDIKQMKAITQKWLENTLLLNPRKEKWVADAIMVSLMIDYVNKYYPDTKLLGKLSDWPIVEWFHAADLDFNYRYPFLYMNIARLNLDQPIATPQDSLIKYNENIATAFKAGIGLKYLESYLEKESLKKSISKFYQKYKLQPVAGSDFEQLLKKNTKKEINWFFNDYVHSNKKIDFTIKETEKVGDSIRVTIKNKSNSHYPVSLYGLKDKEIVFKKWVQNITPKKTVTIPAEGIDRVALNYEGIIPEFNQRDNYAGVTTLFNKPFQLRLLLDVEDPHYSQLFIIPEFSYNLYDGISIGPKLHNKALLPKNFEFDISPKFGFNSHSIIGSASISNVHQFQNRKLYAIEYGVSGNRFSYAENQFYHKLVPYLSFSWRPPYLRDNAFQRVTLRSVSVVREKGKENSLDEPNYTVFNARYIYSDQNMLNYFTALADFQISDKFSKLSINLEYRKLFNNHNHEINLRFYAGTFLFNKTQSSNYFSFALDRPTDYLFDYNYYGRSESSGLFSQQLIMAEGGFKSTLQPAYANQWLTTLNASISLWPYWIYAYGDIGLVKNKNIPAEFVYDSGIRVSLVKDYFELFFPVYSKKGWEVSQPDYAQKIRFIVTLNINTLVQLFTRQWY